MNRIMKSVKYQTLDLVKVLRVYYIIIILIGLFMAIISRNSKGAIDNFGGMGLATIVFIFTSALNSFRTNFFFMQANNLSRKCFFISTGITWMIISALLAILEVIFDQLFRVILPYKGVFEQLYSKNSIVEDFMWCFALFAFTASIGWIITLIYYRSSKIMKVFVSISPILLIFLLGIIDNSLGGHVIGKAIADFSSYVLGFSDQYNSYRAVVSFWIIAVVFYVLSYLLVRKAPIR